MNAKQRACLFAVCAAILFKFWLIAPFEITDDADDPINYVAQILEHKGLCYGPGTGMVGRLFYDLGIPFRLGIEAAWLIAAYLVVTALVEQPTRSGLAAGLYLFVIFNPAVEELLSHFMSDQVWLVETMIGFSLLVFFARGVGRIRWAWAALSGVFLGMSCITRSVFVPLLLALLLWAAMVFLLARRGSREPGWRSLLAGGALCLYGIGCLYFGTCFHNSRSNGFSGLTAFDSREYQHFYTTLQSVGEPDGVAYYPVDDDRLNLIATAGPHARSFVEQLEKNSPFREISQTTYGRPGLALAWFHWGVFQTVDADGDLDRTFASFREVEEEIAQAGQQGRLHVRYVLPLPDCRLPIVLSVVPHCAAHVAALIVAQPRYYAWAWSDGKPTFANPNFTQALRRRTVERSPVRERIGMALATVYTRIYAPLLPGLALALAAFLAALIQRRRELPTCTPAFLPQQIFLVAFVVLYCWYTLFDASGLWAVPRYLVYHNAMLPVLFAYYARQAWLLKSGASGRQSS